MRPMSLYESGDSTGEISLEELFNTSVFPKSDNRLNIDNLAYLICRGGWPHALNMERDIALEQAFDYVDAIVKSDISRVDA